MATTRKNASSDNLENGDSLERKAREEKIRKALPAVVEAINWTAGRKVVELFFVNGQIAGVRKLDNMSVTRGEED
jgi:hypothetical protein